MQIYKLGYMYRSHKYKYLYMSQLLMGKNCASPIRRKKFFIAFE
jgi:hypothetical protein